MIFKTGNQSIRRGQKLKTHKNIKFEYILWKFFHIPTDITCKKLRYNLLAFLINIIL